MEGAKAVEEDKTIGHIEEIDEIEEDIEIEGPEILNCTAEII